jgi:mycothiol synthase
MIKYEWRDHLSPDESAELAALLARSATYDAEPEYSTIDFADVAATLGQCDARHLLIWMLPRSVALDRRDEGERIAGLLRLVCTAGDVAEATLVIDPELRSIGIVTLLLEQLGVDATAPTGWAGTGVHTVTAWARGNHPATARISDRFLIPRTHRTWKLIRSTGPDDITTAAPVLEPIEYDALADIGCPKPVASGGQLLALRESGRVVGLASLDLDAIYSPEFGACGTISCVAYARHADTGPVRRLLVGAAAAAYDAGLEGVTLYIDSHDAGLVNACRLTGFQHDRTDTRYQLGGDS